MAIPLALQPHVQVLEVGLQVLPVLLLRDPIHPHRRMTPLAVIGLFQGRDINQMHQ
jgi:hypothetical protein